MLNVQYCMNKCRNSTSFLGNPTYSKHPSMYRPTLYPLLSRASSSYTSHVPGPHTYLYAQLHPPPFRKDDDVLRQCFFCRQIQQGGACPFNLGPTCSGQTGLETQVKGERLRGIPPEPAGSRAAPSQTLGTLRLSRWKVRGCHGSTRQGAEGP